MGGGGADEAPAPPQLRVIPPGGPCGRRRLWGLPLAVQNPEVFSLPREKRSGAGVPGLVEGLRGRAVLARAPAPPGATMWGR